MHGKLVLFGPTNEDFSNELILADLSLPLTRRCAPWEPATQGIQGIFFALSHAPCAPSSSSPSSRALRPACLPF